jgi:DNA-binding GntR family transcriptional regulator
VEIKIIERKNSENTRQYIYRVLKENIMNLNLKPGEAVGEIELSKILNVSRTPLREAIAQLTTEKLLNVFPQRGSFVSKINLSLVEEAIFLRELCEHKILSIACKDDDTEVLIKNLEKNIEYQKITLNFNGDLQDFFALDNEFHHEFFKKYNKTNIWEAIKRLSIHYDRLRLLDALEKTNIQIILNQHIEILKSIKTKDEKNIKNLIKGHLLNYREIIELYKTKYPLYFCEN